MGERVGWVADGGDEMFLDPDASFAAAQRVGRDTGDPLAIAPRTLHRRLQQAGLLRSVDEVRGRLAIRRTLGDARRVVLHLGASALDGAGPSKGTDDARERDGPFAWAVRDDPPIGTAHERTPGEAAPEHDETTDGPFGPIGPFPEQESKAPNTADVDDVRAAPEGTVVQVAMDWMGLLDRSAPDSRRRRLGDHRVSPVEVLTSLHRRGIILAPSGDGRLRYRPSDALSDTERAEARASPRGASRPPGGFAGCCWRVAVMAGQVPPAGGIQAAGRSARRSLPPRRLLLLRRPAQGPTAIRCGPCVAAVVRVLGRAG